MLGTDPPQDSVVFTSMSVLLGSLAVFSVFLGPAQPSDLRHHRHPFSPLPDDVGQASEATWPALPRVRPHDAYRARSRRRRRRHSRTRPTSPPPIAATARSLGRLGRPIEFIYVVDGQMPRADRRRCASSRRRRADRDPLLRDAVRRGRGAHGGLPARRRRRRVHADAEVQVDARALPRLARGARRQRPGGGRAACHRGEPQPRPQARPHRQRACSAPRLQDIRCGVRAMRAEVAKELTALRQPAPLPAAARPGAGLRASRELDMPAAARRRPRPAAAGRFDLSLLLDVVTIYFLLRFLKKPFRFFGGFGFAVLALGVLFTALAGGRRGCSSACRWSTGRRWSSAR